MPIQSERDRLHRHMEDVQAMHTRLLSLYSTLIDRAIDKLDDPAELKAGIKMLRDLQSVMLGKEL